MGIVSEEMLATQEDIDLVFGYDAKVTELWVGKLITEDDTLFIMANATLTTLGVWVTTNGYHGQRRVIISHPPQSVLAAWHKKKRYNKLIIRDEDMSRVIDMIQMLEL